MYQKAIFAFSYHNKIKTSYSSVENYNLLYQIRNIYSYSLIAIGKRSLKCQSLYLILH